MSESLQGKKGALAASMLRNPKQIRADRGLDIYEDLESVYRTKLENLEREIKKLKRKRDGKIDLSPSNTLSMLMAENFDADKFMVEDIEFSKEIRQKMILQKIIQARYDFLVGDGTESDAPISSDDEPEETTDTQTAE